MPRMSKVKSQRSKVREKVLLTFALLLLTFVVTPSAQSELDALMARVLERRDENWKKLQQYTLNERDQLQITALAVFRLYGFDREYVWFPREGFFVRSPLKADGVKIGKTLFAILGPAQPPVFGAPKARRWTTTTGQDRGTCSWAAA